MSSVFIEFLQYNINMKYKFAERLKELRTENKLSMVQLAKLMGITDGSICRWENGKHDIRGEELFKLAQIFKVSMDYLAGLED